MPDIAGFELAERAQSIHSRTQSVVVGVSAAEIYDASERVHEVGMDDYVTKPITKLERQHILEPRLERPGSAEAARARSEERYSNAAKPVSARPMARVWISWVPS